MNNVTYPEYQEVEKYISHHQEYLQSFSEYDEINHERMRQVCTMIYIMDNDSHNFRIKIRAIGWDRHREGCVTAMRGCYYCLVVALRLITSNNRRDTTQGSIECQVDLRLDVARCRRLYEVNELVASWFINQVI